MILNKIMNLIRLIILFLLTPALVLTPALARTQLNVPGKCFNEENQGIKFLTGLNWEQIKNKAKMEGKYIFIDVYASWCKPCKMMDQVVYPDKEVGQLMNEKFISIKVKGDLSKTDNQEIKNWYNDAQKLKITYEIDAYPTYLFFNPSGILINKEIGFKSIRDFIGLIKASLDPKNLTFYDSIEKYKRGYKDYNNLPGLARKAEKLGDRQLAMEMASDFVQHVDKKELLTSSWIYFVRDIARNSKLADSLALEYKLTYLDNLNTKELLTREHLMFINDFSQLIKSNDSFFYNFYLDPLKIDKIIGVEGWTNRKIAQVITREQIEPLVYKNDKSISQSPNWEKLKNLIKNKYIKVDANRILLEFQIHYYRKLENWNKWYEYKNKHLNLYPPKITGLECYVVLNVYGAWDAFLHCNNKKVLKKSIKWIDLAIKLDEVNKASYLDTKANLLYKLGKTNKAIVIEKEALSIEPGNEEMKTVMTKMENNEKTW